MRLFFLFILLFVISSCSNLDLNNISCGNDDNCPKGTECIAGKCKLKTVDSSCKEDKNCPEGKFCIAGKCLENNPCSDVVCGEGGNCIPTDKDNYKCSCDEGYENKDQNETSPCVPIGKCDKNSDCGNGICDENKECQCYVGYHYDIDSQKCKINGEGCKRENAYQKRCNGNKLEICKKDENCTDNCDGIAWGKWVEKNRCSQEETCTYNNSVAFCAYNCSNTNDCNPQSETCIDGHCIPTDTCNNNDCYDSICITDPENGLKICEAEANCNEGDIVCREDNTMVSMCISSEDGSTTWFQVEYCDEKSFCNEKQGYAQCISFQECGKHSYFDMNEGKCLCEIGYEKRNGECKPKASCNNEYNGKLRCSEDGKSTEVCENSSWHKSTDCSSEEICVFDPESNNLVTCASTCDLPCEVNMPGGSGNSYQGSCYWSSTGGGSGFETMKECFCNDGYMNDGGQCVEAYEDCNDPMTCGDPEFSTCRYDFEDDSYTCICKPGWEREIPYDKSSKCIKKCQSNNDCPQNYECNSEAQICMKKLRIFVTSSETTINFGTDRYDALSNMDNFCNSEREEDDPANYKALVAREDWPLLPNRNYYNYQYEFIKETNNDAILVFSDNPSQNQHLIKNINGEELDNSVWTGIDKSGNPQLSTPTTTTCDNWTSSSEYDSATTGLANVKTYAAFDHAPKSCNGSYHIYCVEQEE